MSLNPGTHSGTPTYARQDEYHYNLSEIRGLDPTTVESTVDLSNGGNAANLARGINGTMVSSDLAGAPANVTADADGRNLRIVQPLITHITLSEYHHTPSGTDVVFTRADDGTSRRDISIKVNDVYVGIMVWNGGSSQHEATISGLTFYQIVTVDFVSLLDGIYDRITAYIGSVGSLVHWFDFSDDDRLDLDGDRVDRVRDAMGDYYFDTVTDERRPTLGMINGVQAAVGDGDVWLKGPSNISLAGDLTMVILAQLTVSTGGALLGIDAGDWHGVNNSSNLRIRESDTNYIEAATIGTTTARVFIFRRSGTTWTGGADGYGITWGHTSTVIPWLIRYIFGHSGTGFWNGPIGEARIYNRALTDAELDLLIIELNAKWGL